MAERGRVPPALRLCRGCEQFVVPGPSTCHFCGGDLAVLERAYEERQAAIRRAAGALREALAARGIAVGRADGTEKPIASETHIKISISE